MFAGLSLREDRAMWSFLKAMDLCSTSAAKASKKWHCKKITGTKLLDRADMSWFGLITSCHFERVGNSNFHGDRSKGIARSQMSSKRSPDCIATSAAPKSKALTFCSHHENFDFGHLRACLHVHCIQALIPTCVSKGMKMKTLQKMVAQDMSIYGRMFCRRSHVSTRFTQIYSNDQISSNLPGKSRGILPKTPPA